MKDLITGISIVVVLFMTLVSEIALAVHQDKIHAHSVELSK